MPNRLVTFRVSLASLPGFDPLNDLVSVRGSFNNWAAEPLVDPDGDGMFTGTVVVEGAQGAGIQFKYVVSQGGTDYYDELPGEAALANRTYTLGPEDVPVFISPLPHVFGSLDPIAPQNIGTGSRTFTVPVYRAPYNFTVKVWDSFVGWDGNAAVTARGLIYATQPLTLGVFPSGVQTVLSGAGVGSYQAEIAGVGPGDTLYFRAFATNSQGTSYGPEQTVEIPSNFLGTSAPYQVAVACRETGDNLTKQSQVIWKLLDAATPPSANAGQPSADLEWDIYRVTPLAAVKIYSGKPSWVAGAPPWNTSGTIGSGFFSFTDTVNAGESVEYFAGYRNAAGDLSYTGAASLTVAPWVLPAAPVVSAVSQSPFTARLSWPSVAGTALYEVRLGRKILGQTDSTTFLVTNLEPRTAYTFDVAAVNGGGESPTAFAFIQTQSWAAQAKTTDRIRVLPATGQFSASADSVSIPASVSEPDKKMKTLWVLKKSAGTHNANLTGFSKEFLGPEDLGDNDWLIDGLAPASWDKLKERVLLSDSAPLSIIRPADLNFFAAYGGEYIDGRLRQTLIHYRINTNDIKASDWIAEAYPLPGAKLTLKVLFYTNVQGTILRLGGPTLYYASFKKIGTFESEKARRSASAMTQLLNSDGSQNFVQTEINCSEEELVMFRIVVPQFMQDTQTTLVVVAER